MRDKGTQKPLGGCKAGQSGWTVGVRAALRTGRLGLRLVLWEDRVESPLSCPAHLPPALLHHPGRKSLVLAFFCCRQKSQHSESSLFTSEVQFSRAVVSDSLRPHGCSPPGSSVCGILQASILEWVAMPFSRGSSQPRDQTQVPHIAGRFFTV